MRVLLSIKPEFAFKILDGSKQYEYRRVIFKNTDVNMVLVYASDPIQKVIGEFEIDGILHDDVQVLWEKTESHAGISKKRFLQYFRNKTKGYAIKVREAKKYEHPILLSVLKLTWAPQSFMYYE